MQTLTRLTSASLVLALAGPALAATVTWDGEGANNQWSTAENWSDNAAPTAGNDYVVDGVLFRSPYPSTSTSTPNTYTFDGDSLTVQNAAVFNLYRINTGGYYNVTHNFNTLTVNNAQLRPESSNGSIGHTLNGDLVFTGANTINMNEASNFTMRMILGTDGDDTLTGSGTLLLTRDATGSTRSVDVFADASGYSGDVSFAGLSGDIFELRLYNTAGLGTGDIAAGSYTSLQLLAASGVNIASSSVSLAGNSTLNLGAGPSTVGALSIAGNDVAADTYTAAELTALGFGGTFSGDGTITVVPEPGSLALIALGGLLIARRRRA